MALSPTVIAPGTGPLGLPTKDASGRRGIDFYKFAPGQDWLFANGLGATGKYGIFRLDSAGRMTPPAQIIGPVIGNAGSGILHVAWHNAVQMADRQRIYAVRNNGTIWADIAYWDSFDSGATWAFGAVAITGATYGYGPPVLIFIPGDANPINLLVPVRTSTNVPNFNLFSSANGSTFTDTGVAFTATETWESSGITASHFMRRSDGTYILAYHAYETSNLAHAACAYATNPRGPYINRRKLYSPVAEVGTLSAAAAAKQNIISVSGVTPRVNEAYGIFSSGGTEAEIVVVDAVKGANVYLTRPLVTAAASGAEFFHVASRKVDPQFLWEAPDGWHMMATAYGGTASTTVETVIGLSAPTLEGTWALDPAGILVQPWNLETKNSLENISPLIDVR